MKFAYADPPYIGQARHHYKNDPSGIQAQEVDHKKLIEDMCAGYDAWALSLSSPTLKQILSYCPDDVRVGAWVKPFASFKPGVNPAYTWEPVIFWHTRPMGRDALTVRDWVSCNITMQRGTHGAKPDEFCNWLFMFAGLEFDDTFVDLYPGSGGVGAALEIYRMHMLLKTSVTSEVI